MEAKIRLVRRNLALTQKDFAKVVGVSWSTLQKWEAGDTRPQPEHMRALAAVAGKPISWFYEEEQAA